MTAQIKQLEPGLYLVATPIGTARDITLRALDVLASADIIAAEDTRNARHLLDLHGVDLAGRPLWSYHDHNGPAVRPAIMAALARGQSVAYVSDAGMPLIADPGYGLVTEAHAAGHAVTAVPGASSVTTALAIGGLPTDRFFFAGFAPHTGGARRSFFAEFREIPGTLVFFETGKRLAKSLKDMQKVLGPDRQMRICRELTKRYEEIIAGTIGELCERVSVTPPKGEIVLLVDRARASASAGDMNAALSQALETMRTRDAADAVATELGLPRRQVYQAALAMAKAKE